MPKLRLLLAACVAAAAAGCGKDDPSVPGGRLAVPAAWSGTWRIVLTSLDCPSDSLLGVDVIVDDVCTGEPVETFLGLEAEGLEMRCTGSFTDTNLDAHCSGGVKLGCTVTVTVDFAAVRTDSLFDGTGTVFVRTECSNGSETECYDAVVVAERIAPVPAGCDSTGVAKLFLPPSVRSILPRR
jgi:hypothetical protein